MAYFIGGGHLPHLRDQVGVVRLLVTGRPKRLPLVVGKIQEVLELVAGGGWRGGHGLCEVALVADAQGCLAVGELTVVGVEGVGAPG